MAKKSRPLRQGATAVCFVAFCAMARPLLGGQMTNKAIKKVVEDRYKGKVAVVLRKGLGVSVCAHYTGSPNNQWNVLPLNEKIEGERISVDRLNPLGSSSDRLASALSGVSGGSSLLTCSGPQQIAVEEGDEVRVTHVGVWGKEARVIELYVGTIDRREVQRSILGTSLSSMDQGWATWSFVPRPAISEAGEVLATLEFWLKPFESELDASSFATTIKKAAELLVGSQVDREDATVTVTSSPAGADIILDEKFVGSTPSTLQIAPGEHRVSVRIQGLKAWERTISLTSGSKVTLDAVLDKDGP